MLTLHLTLTNNQVSVRANGKESHQFSLLELSQSEQEWKDFYKNPRTYGEKLFNALFRDAARAEFDALSKQTERTIVLVLESSELDGVAWEYAYNKAKEEYVVEDCAFVRALPEKERPANGRMKNEVERVPLLFIPANPLVDLSGEPMRALDVEGEWREMKRLIEKSNAPFDMIELRPATPEALQSVMARFQNGMIAHFSGHGAATKDGAILLFERENGASNPLEAREFVREIKDKAWIGFLSACQSAVPERTEFSNLARELAKAGVPFALGMQFNLPDPFAPNISGQFYNYLAHGHAVPEAARQARRAVKRENEFHEIMVGMIALYAAHPDEVGKLVWRGVNAQTVSLFRPADVSDLPSPASGLIGRQRELMRIGTRLLEDTRSGPLTVTLHGAGGIGKTALLWQALLRFAPSFELTLAIGLDPLPSLESVLGRVERFLGLPSPCSNDTKEREAMVRNALTSKRMLLGLDNFETLNYALNEKGSDEEKTAKSLHTFFKSLAANGVALCITSREVTNLPGEIIEDIQGLTNESGGGLFQENVVKQKDEIYIEKTQQVSEMVGGHPLALRLLASAFDDQVGTSLDQYIESLQSFLPKAHDRWTEEDRHESLRASFDFTMNNLLKTAEGKELQVALSRLSVFIAYFVDFTAAPVLENKYEENDEENKAMLIRTNNILHMLWERGLLERLTLPLGDENFYLYRLHPALNQFAAEHVTPEEMPIIQKNYYNAMWLLANGAYPGSKTGGIHNSPFLTAITREAMPDILKAMKLEKDKKATYMLLFYAAFLKSHFGSLDESMALYKRALEIAENLGDLKDNAAILSAMAYIHRIQGNLNEAKELYQQSLEIAEKIGALDIMASTLTMMAPMYSTLGDTVGAMKLYKRSLEIAEKLGDANIKSVAFHNMAGIHIASGNLDEGMRLLQQAFTLFEEMNNQKGKSDILRKMADIYQIRGDLDEAIKLCHESLDIAEKLGDRMGKSDTLSSIALIFRQRNNLNESMKLYQESLKIKEELGDKKGKSDILHEMGSIFVASGDLEKAEKLYQQALEVAEELGDLQAKSATLNNLGDVYRLRQDMDKAIELFQISLGISKDLNDAKGECTSLVNIGVAQFQQKQYRHAIENLTKALVLFEKIGARLDAQNVANLLIQARQNLGLDFDVLWNEITSQTLPDWLSQSPQQAQGMTAEQFIAEAIQSAREKRPEAEGYFKSAQKMAADSSVPAEMRELGRVLQRIMIGDKNVDLSSLPKEWADLIAKALNS